MTISRLSNTISNNNFKKATLINTGMALVAVAGIAIGVKCCNNKIGDNKIEDRIEMISYNGCRTPQDKIIRSAEFSLGAENPFKITITQNDDTQEPFLVLTAKKEDYNAAILKQYPISRIKACLGLKQNVIGQNNNSQEVSNRRNWHDDRATVEAGKSIRIPLRELGKTYNFDNENLYQLKHNVIDLYADKNLSFNETKMKFESFIDKNLESDKNSLRTTLTGKGGKFYIKITRTDDSNRNQYMYRMDSIKSKLGLKDGVILKNNVEKITNIKGCPDYAVLLPYKSIYIPIEQLGQSKESKNNERLKREAYKLENF